MTEQQGQPVRESRLLGKTTQRIASQQADPRASDAELLARVRQRDETALAELYDRHAGLVLSVALRIVGDRDLAEEVLQDTFLRCWQHADSFQSLRGGAVGWLMGITRNRAIDMLRSRQHKARLREQGVLPEADALGIRGAPDESENVLVRHAVASALADLSITQRRVIELAYYGGMTQTEIAHMTGEPLGTVKSRTRIAMEHLRTTLRPWFNATPDTDSDGRE